MTLSLIWKAFKMFLGNHWQKIALIASILFLFFAARSYILHAIDRHDQAIVRSVEERKDAEWQAKLDKQLRELLEDLANVRKNSKDLERHRPANQSDTIKLLRSHRLNAPQ